VARSRPLAAAGALVILVGVSISLVLPSSSHCDRFSELAVVRSPRTGSVEACVATGDVGANHPTTPDVDRHIPLRLAVALLGLALGGLMVLRATRRPGGRHDP
jgi:hypothetical protein